MIYRRDACKLDQVFFVKNIKSFLNLFPISIWLQQRIIKKGHNLTKPIYTHEMFFLQISPTRCTIPLNTFIALLYMFRASMCPSSGEKLLYLCDTGICHSVWVATGLLVGVSLQPADQTPPIQSDKYQCRIDTVIFSWWWAHGCPKHVEKWNTYIKQNCAPSWN